MPQRPANVETVYKTATKRPDATFGYQPFVDFYNELANAGPSGLSVAQLRERLVAQGWRRPRGGELTLRITRIDLVSMCKYGFVDRLTD